MRFGMACLAVVLMWVVTANADERIQGNYSTRSRVEVLEQQMKALLSEREVELAELGEQYKQSQPSERVALELAYAERQRMYQLSLGELMVEYFDLTGNSIERDRAARQLAQLQSESAEVTLPQLAPRPARNNAEVTR